MFERDLLGKSRIRELVEAIGTLDFAVVDDSWVFISNLDGQRKVVAVGATKDGIILKEDTDLFDEAIRLATGVGNVTNSASSNS